MKHFIALVLMTGACTLAHADPYGYDNDTDDSNRGYESSFGNRYEYDLSDPGDRLQYGVDPDAQLRDSLDVDPTRDLERGIGEYGGGAYDD